MRKVILLGVILLMTSCVSKRKYAELEGKYKAMQLGYTELQNKNIKIQKHIDNYNRKIQTLKGVNQNLQQQNDVKYDLVGNVAVISNDMKRKLKETLRNVDPSVLANAKTLKDSMNIAVSYNLKNRINNFNLPDKDVNVNIDDTVVMISIADNLLFKSGSYHVSIKAISILDKLAEIIKSEPSMDVMIEGHADSRSINTGCIVDNWDLSVKRATSIVRLLEKNYKIKGERLIASGRGSTVPLVDNNTKKNRALNRRTKIIILPNLDKFFGMLAEKEQL